MSTMQLILISLVVIESMFTFAFERAPNIVSATPWWLRIPTPMTETSAMSVADATQKIPAQRIRNCPSVIRESIRFYLGESSFALNEDFPEALAAEIGFDKQVEVTLARYAHEGHELFLVGYPTASLAEVHFIRLHNALQGYFSDEGVYMKHTGLIVSIFFGPEARAEEILAKIHYLPTIKWLYQKDQDAEDMRETITSFLGLLRNTAATFGFFVSLSIVLGVTAGFARVKILRRFPQLLKKGDPILLKLD